MHSHIIPERLPRFGEQFGYDGFIHLEHHRHGYAKMMIGDRFFREIEENCWNPEKRLDDFAKTKNRCSGNLHHTRNVLLLGATRTYPATRPVFK